MVGLAAAHAAVLIAFPTAPVIALGLWWNSNTVSHNFIHRPFFRRRPANRLFAAYLSVLLGSPSRCGGIAISRITRAPIPACASRAT